ncbi:MAG: precorrin-8X methylmutase [Deltaproteobacteria bacterium]|nr:precorrin-8X methylmutase [Deltaproteobacteria bacterium]
MMSASKGAAIEAESFRIVEEELGEHPFPALEFPLVRRVIHATADFELGRSLRFSPDAVRSGMAAIGEGAPVITDIHMAASGISRAGLSRIGGSEICCRIGDPGIIDLAGRSGITRSAAAVRSFGPMLEGALVVIGNAPTALREILRLHHEEGIQPKLVIGVPVGFVDAAESKRDLRQSGLTCITNEGRKGGTPVAVALVNAMIRLVLQERRKKV